MQTKLTLRLEESLIEGAKAYAKSSGRSVSQIVADYFALLDSELTGVHKTTTPIVSSLCGALTKVDVDAREIRREMRGRSR